MTLALTDTRPPFEAGSLLRHSAFALVAIFGLMGGLTLWAASTQIQGAVIAPGMLLVEGFAKQVQHVDGGIVTEILVRDEDEVKEGDVLLQLDTTAIRASLAVIDAQRNESLIVEARAAAALAGETGFDLPAELSLLATDASIAANVATQQQVLAAQIADRDGRIAQFEEQVAQLDLRIEGLELQRQAMDTQVEILSGRVADMQQLYDKNLIEAGPLSTLKLQLADAQGEQGRLIAEIGQSRGTIAEKTLQIEQIRTEFTQKVLAELQQVRQVIAETTQQKVATEDKLRRTTLRAPQSGIIHESTVHTIGGVVAPSQVLMKIVPQSDEIVVEIHVDPLDIDQVSVGQRVQLRFSGLDRREVPEAWGEIVKLSPDRVIEPNTNRTYYTAEVYVSPEERAALPSDIRFLPGMPVETFVATGDRTVLDYLLHPFVEELQLAFRER
jgi:HlyD family secretion protein